MHLKYLGQLAVASLATSAAVRQHEVRSSANGLSASAQSLFDYSMFINDPRHDESYNFIIYPNTGPWSVRFTAWFIADLLHRNTGSDLKNAKAANAAVYDIPSISLLMFLTFRVYPLSKRMITTQHGTERGNSLQINTYDPNWREFIGTQLVQIVEEFSDLIGSELVSHIITAMEIAAVGEMRRNGTVGDNLVIAYTNPALMRALTVGWTGARTGNQTLMDHANTQGTEITALFKKGSNVFSEYNALTYYGEDIWALVANMKYGPKNSTMFKNAPFLLTTLWEDIAAHYNAYLGNFVGPYDRANSRDLTTHSAVLPLWFWGSFGYENAPEPNKIELDLIYDATQGAAFALVISTLEKYIGNATMKALQTPPTDTEERFLNATIADSMYNDTTRTATSWMSKNLMIGGQRLGETTARSGQFVPAIVHWTGDASHKPYPYVSFFSLYPTATTITAVASKNKLTISYPDTTQAGTDSFQFMLSNVPPGWSMEGNVIGGFANLPCLNATVTAPGLVIQPVVYGDTIYDHIYYNLTYAVPANSTGVPKIEFDLVYTC